MCNNKPTHLDSINSLLILFNKNFYIYFELIKLAQTIHRPCFPNSNSNIRMFWKLSKKTICGYHKKVAKKMAS